MRAILFSASMCILATGCFATECVPNQGYEAVDVSQPITERFASGVKSIGVSTIIRYYDWQDESIPHKTLTLKELELMKRYGLQSATVFQHFNNKIETFEDPNRGRQDAERSLDLAHTLKQPESSAIYFGVDGVDAFFTKDYAPGGIADPCGLKKIEAYFQSVRKTFIERKKHYRVGVYGSGLVCRQLLSKKLADLCWLANATSWPEYTSFLNSKHWVLRQFLPTHAKDCFGMEADPSAIVQPGADYGQWSPK